MRFNIEIFLDRLREKALSKQEAAQMVQEEIRKAENQKVGFLDQVIENPDFYRLFSSHVDNYITYLKVLHNGMALQGQQEPDEQIDQTHRAMVDRTLELVKQLEQVERSRMGANHGARQEPV